jgi:ABC-2 type transport system ATP-binding protein
VIVKVAGDEEGLNALLTNTAGVLQVGESKEGGLELEVSPGKDIRPDIARSVVGAGYDLLELRPVGMSLEDIFLELTRDEPQAPEVSDADEDETGPEEESD